MREKKIIFNKTCLSKEREARFYLGKLKRIQKSFRKSFEKANTLKASWKVLDLFMRKQTAFQSSLTDSQNPVRASWNVFRIATDCLGIAQGAQRDCQGCLGIALGLPRHCLRIALGMLGIASRLLKDFLGFSWDWWALLRDCLGIAQRLPWDC